MHSDEQIYHVADAHSKADTYRKYASELWARYEGVVKQLQDLRSQSSTEKAALKTELEELRESGLTKGPSWPR